MREVKSASRGVGKTWVALVLLVLILFLANFGMTLGDISLSPSEVISALLGQGSRASRLVVLEWRLPRVLAALILGAALALSGAIFQRLTRNPLGSPDIMGFNMGSLTGVMLATILGLNTNYWITGISALVGGILTAAAVYLLSYKGGLNNFSFIVVGVAMSSLLSAINTWFMTSFGMDSAFATGVWGAGSLAHVSWASLLVATPVVVTLILSAYLLVPLLKQMELGDEKAATTGVAVEPARLLLILVGLGLTAIATAVAGPLIFIALVAPQIANRLVPHREFLPLLTALVGVFLLLGADLLAQHAFPQIVLPTGAVTISLGGLYLLVLLTVGNRIRRS